MPFTRDALADAAALIYRQMPPTPQFAWPLLGQRLGAEVWVNKEIFKNTYAYVEAGHLKSDVITYANGKKKANAYAAGVIWVF